MGRRLAAPSRGSAQVLSRPRILASGCQDSSLSARNLQGPEPCGEVVGAVPEDFTRLHNNRTNCPPPSSQVGPLRPRKAQIAGQILRKHDVADVANASANSLTLRTFSKGDATVRCTACRPVGVEPATQVMS